MHGEGIHQKIVEFTNQTIEEQIAFVNSLKRAEPEIVRFSIYEKPKTKQQILKK